MEVSDNLSHYGSSVISELRNVGERVGRFEIVELLAVTLLGPLYRVRMNRGGGAHLLQVIPSGLGNDPQMRRQLTKRFEQLSKIESELVLRPEEIVDFEETIAIVYPDWSGRPLSAQRHDGSVGEDAAMTPSEVKNLIQRIVLSLESAALVQIHHYGLTPDFILLENSGAIKVWGMGVLQSVSRRKFEIFISSAIVPLQKESSDDPNYTVLEALSPEWRNDEPVDVRSDLFSVGVLGHNLLAGHIREVTGGEEAEVDTEIPPGWAVYLSRLLESDPAARYQTTTAVAKDLDRVDNLHLGPLKPHTIDRLPLPKGVERRVNLKVGRAIRMGALACLGIFALATAFLLYSVLTIDSGATVKPEIFLAGEKPPQLILRLSPEKAQVKFFGDGGASFVTGNGEIALRGKGREYIGIVQAPQHISQRFSVTLHDTLQMREIALELAWGNLRLTAPPGSRLDIRQPSGELIFLDYVPDGGQLEIAARLFAETYTFVISLPGHEPVEFPDIVLKHGEWTELWAEPVALPASLSVVSNPAGLPVRIDGRRVGMTPLKMDDLFWPEPVTVSVGGGNLRTREKVFRLFPGRENVLDFGDVEATQGDLQLAVSLQGRALGKDVLERLRIVVNERVYESVVDLQVSLSAGFHTVRVEHPDYLPRGGKVEIQDEAVKRLAVDLRPRPATIAVELPTTLSDYWVEWEGERQPLKNGQFLAPAAQAVTITLGSADHYPVERAFLLPANGSATWKPDLKSLPGPTMGADWTLPNLPLGMVWLPAGSGQFGSPVKEPQRRPNEDELTRANFSSGIWIARTEVTQAAYEAVMGENPSRYRGADFPVESVPWKAAMEFCRRLSDKERAVGRMPPGYVYRLPTEAEWEYAARAGSPLPFYFGETAEGTEGNFFGEYPRDYKMGSAPRETVGTLAVASFTPNPWGLYDVVGNVAEWTLDAYNERLPGGVVEDFWRQGEGRGRPIRGGAWTDPADRCRSASRDLRDPEHGAPSIGFRIVLARDLEY